MSNRILVSTDHPHAKLLVEVIDHLAAARAGFHRLQDATGQMTYGSPADYQQMATELGMASAQTAADLASLMALVQPKIDDADISQFISRCDQGG